MIITKMFTKQGNLKDVTKKETTTLAKVIVNEQTLFDYSAKKLNRVFIYVKRKWLGLVWQGKLIQEGKTFLHFDKGVLAVVVGPKVVQTIFNRDNPELWIGEPNSFEADGEISANDLFKGLKNGSITILV